MVDIIGGIKGADKCPKCSSEIRNIRNLLHLNSNIITFFSEIGYREEIKQIPGKWGKYWVVHLLCGGLLLYKHDASNITQAMVQCDD